MRYGIVREIEGLPPPAIQRRRIEAAGCDTILEQAEITRDGQRALRKFVASLKRGDDLSLCSLDVLQVSTGELAVILRRFVETGVSLRLLGSSTVETLVETGGVPQVLLMLAEHEARRPTRPPTLRRSRASRKALSRHQIDYARGLRKRGESLRTIGLLFQVTPNELLELMGGDVRA